MPMIDTDRFKLQLDNLATAEATRNSVNGEWKNLDEAQKLKDAAAFKSRIEDAQLNYLGACEQLAWAVAWEIERVEREG